MLSPQDQVVRYLSGIFKIGGYVGIVVAVAIAAFFLR